MKSLVHDLQNLEAVKAPDDFLSQLHERMDRRFDFSAFISVLFRPFRIKIPLQLATAAVMALLIFTIVHTPQIETPV